MVHASPLLQLPRELRNLIWRLTFSDFSVTPSQTPPRNLEECLACYNDPALPTPYSIAYIPLLTCKQIYAEAATLFRKTLDLRITDLTVFERLVAQPKHLLCTLTKSLTIDVHLDEDNRETWVATANELAITFPALQQLTVHNHMRPPMSYDGLIDAIYFAKPLVRLPAHLNPTVHYAYVLESIMFENATFGVVRVSEALEEHSAVVRSVLVDTEFKAAATQDDWHGMTNCLLEIARAHEQPWRESLQRRRRENPPMVRDPTAVAQSGVQ